ncbi:hypothetical protein BH09GEM1_BH09GEM1_14960 [soil metagenome]
MAIAELVGRWADGFVIARLTRDCTTLLVRR